MNEFCTWSRDHFTRCLDDELSAQERVRLDEHLASCADCRAALEALRTGDELARDASSATSADEEQTFDTWLRTFTNRHDLESAARLRSEEIVADEAAGRAGREFLSAEEVAARPLEPELTRGGRRAWHPAWRWARIAIPAAAAAVVVVVLLVREPGLPEKAMAPMVSVKQRVSEPAQTLGAAPSAAEAKPEGAAATTLERAAVPAIVPAPAPVPERKDERAAQPAPASELTTPVEQLGGEATAAGASSADQPSDALGEQDLSAPPAPAQTSPTEANAPPPTERSRTIESRGAKAAESDRLALRSTATTLGTTRSAHDAIESFAPKTAGDAPLTHAAADQRVLFYFHGQIVEDQGRRAVSDRYGPYEYDAILDALRAGGYTVISEVRPKGTDPLTYAGKVVGQIDSLKAAGVPSDHITVVGASKGGIIAIHVADLLRDEAVNYVLLAICGQGTLGVWAANDICPIGHVLSIYDAADPYAATCDPLFNRCASLITEQRELKLDLGVGHGLVFKPLKEWVEPTLAWGRR